MVKGILAVRRYLFRCLFCFSLSNSIFAFDIPEAAGPKDFPYESFEVFKRSGEKGILSSFLGSPNLHSNTNQVSYYLSAPSVVAGRYLIGNYTDNKMDFMVLCLIDYSLVPCLENKENKLFNASVNPKNAGVYNIKIRNLSKGSHDLTLLSLDKKSLTQENGHFYHRAVIHVDKDTFSTKEIYKPTQISSVSPNYFLILNHSPSPSDFSDKKTLIRRSSVFAHAFNGAEEDVEFQLFTIFFDEKFEEISSFKSKEVVTILANHSAVIQLSNFIPANGKHVIAFLVANPYKNLEIDGGLLKMPTAILKSKIQAIN